MLVENYKEITVSVFDGAKFPQGVCILVQIYDSAPGWRLEEGGTLDGHGGLFLLRAIVDGAVRARKEGGSRLSTWIPPNSCFRVVVMVLGVKSVIDVSEE